MDDLNKDSSKITSDAKNAVEKNSKSIDKLCNDLDKVDEDANNDIDLLILKQAEDLSKLKEEDAE